VAEEWKKGYIQVYTGDGKGKTTAALGLALRAAGAGLKVLIVQFVKGMHYAELDALEELKDRISVLQAGRECFITQEPDEKDIQAAREGLDTTRRAIQSGDYRLVIMDEANIATHYNLFSVDELIDVIQSRREDVEIVITGRKAESKLLEMADLVTDMRNVKHYYTKGVAARSGIEK
jgi:cob(I)alamin adenosyltransferase